MTSMLGAIRVLPVGLSWRHAQRVVERNVLSYRRNWFFLVSGFFEPFFYLLGIGLGLQHLVGSLAVGGRPVGYALFVAPGLLASAAMNGAVFDSTYNFFFRLKVEHTYEAMLATPLEVMDIALGELAWTVVRGVIYAGGFLCVMAGFGYCSSLWAIAALPGAALVSAAFGAVGLAATSYMKSWQDLGSVSLAVLPLFLFSGIFYGIDVYPGWLQAIVRCTPLYQGVELLRGLDVGAVGPTMLLNVAYLCALGVVGLWIVGRRLRTTLTP